MVALVRRQRFVRVGTAIGQLLVSAMDIKYKRQPLGVIAKLAEFATKTTWSDLPANAQSLAHMHFVDTVATTLGGAREPSTAACVAVARYVDARPVASVVAHGFKSSPDLAAFVNGVMCHSIDWDDWTTTSMHPSAVVAPVTFALGEVLDRSGREVLEAYAIGCETLLQLARAISPLMYLRGFHPTGTLGAIGAATAAARLLKLSTEQTKMAFAAAMHQCGGLGQGRGTHQKPLSAGNAARAGIVAALLVQNGFTASPDVLESWNGIQDTYLAGLDGQYDLAAVIASIGEVWNLTEPWPIKLYAAGGARQTTLAVAIRLANRYNIDPEQIEAIEAIVSPVTAKIDYTRPFSALNTRFSNTWCIAVALLTRSGDPEVFSEERFADERVWQVLDKIKLIADESLPVTPTAGFPTKLTIRMKDGAVYIDQIVEMPGEATNPLTWEHIFEKFGSAAGQALSEDRRARVWEWLQGMEGESRFSELMELIGERSPALGTA